MNKKIKVILEKPLPLKKSEEKTMIFSVDLNKIPKSPGIYIFARRWNKSFKALYVGISINLNGRIKNHLKSLPLMKFIENAKFGEKVLFVGKVAPCPGQKLETIMKIAEKAYIRHFLANGHDLANKSGIRMMEHEINSEGKVYKSFIPSRMYLNK